MILKWTSIPVGKIAKKQSEGVLKIQCHVVKDTLLQTSFSAILPTGMMEKLNTTYKLIFYHKMLIHIKMIGFVIGYKENLQFSINLHSPLSTNKVVRYPN